MRLLLLLFCLVSYGKISAQNLYGNIKDALNGEDLGGVTINILHTKSSVSSNHYGFYSIHLNKFPSEIKFSLIGYKSMTLKIDNNTQLQQDIFLAPLRHELEEVVISSKGNKVFNLQTSSQSISQDKILAIPSLTGTPDVLKSLQLLPGVQTANEGTTNLNVRGGSFDQNLILLDEAPVYNSSHALGFFSNFNADIIKSATIYKGNFPAQYGGRLSSVIDIATKEGNNNRYGGSFNFGITSNQLVFEGPIKKKKSSFILSFRNSNTAVVLSLLPIIQVFSKNAQIANVASGDKIWFYDFNIKMNFIINEKNRIFFSSYRGYDDYNFTILGNRNTTEWGNWTNSFRWNHVYNQKLFSNLTAYTSSFTNINNNDFTLKKYRWKSDILELGLKLDFTHFVNNKNTLKYGAALSHKQFNPGIIELVDTTNAFSDYASQYTRNYELNLYISNEQEISDKVSLQYGLRYTFFADVGPYNQYSYKNNQGTFIDTNIYIPPNQLKDAFHSLEPRLAFRYLLNDFSSLKTSITYNQQNLHLLSNSSVGLPYDIWITASSLVKPQTSWQYTIGYYANFLKNKLNFSAEIYYKDLYNIIDFKDNANLFLNKYIEQSILPGIGRSYGLELFLEKNGKKFSGWISYTYGDTKYKINGVNGNRWFSPRYDIRHNLSIVAVYKVSKRFEFSSTFKITSGGFISFPTRSFRFDDAIFVVYDGRNNYQLPTYHRLDVAFRVRSKNYEKQKLKKEWFFSIYNLYGQENIFALNVRPDIGNLGGIDLGRNQTSSNKAYYTYLFGIVPTITFSLKF